MELQQFIEKTVKEVSTSLHNSSIKMVEENFGKGISDLNPMMLEFDIAVTVTNDHGANIGGKITVLGIELGGAKTQKERSEYISRIKFTVPLRLKTLDEKINISVL